MVRSMVFMVRKLLWVALGAVGALELDRRLSRQRARLFPNGVTTSLLDRLNRTLERRSSSV
jgi:uncharacterized membrane protein YgdD (TMEM256/DUF423 family)